MDKLDNLSKIIEGILFVSGDGVSVDDIAEKLEVSKKEISKAIDTLKEEYANRGINIVLYKGKAQMCSNPEIVDDISLVLNPIKEKQLTKAALETVAVIAYKQPITRLEIEEVRGVNCDYALQLLSNFKMIEVIGRKDAVGKPLLFGTTDEFLKRFQISDISELPDYNELLDRIKLIHEDNKDDSLYNNFKIPTDEEEEQSYQQDNGIDDNIQKDVKQI